MKLKLALGCLLLLLAIQAALGGKNKDKKKKKDDHHSSGGLGTGAAVAAGVAGGVVVGAGVGLLGGAALGVMGTAAVMDTYSSYQNYLNLVNSLTDGPDLDDYYNRYIKLGRCFGDCPSQAHCIMAICQCNPGLEQKVGLCRGSGENPAPRKEHFDPHIPCTDSKVCQSLDINLVCNTTNQAVGSCMCRRDMLWNEAAGECQLHIGVDCSSVNLTAPTTTTESSITTTTTTTTTTAEVVSSSETLTTLPSGDSVSSETTTVHSETTTIIMSSVDSAHNTSATANTTSNTDVKKAALEEAKIAFCKEIERIRAAALKSKDDIEEHVSSTGPSVAAVSPRGSGGNKPGPAVGGGALLLLLCSLLLLGNCQTDLQRSTRLGQVRAARQPGGKIYAQQ